MLRLLVSIVLDHAINLLPISHALESQLGMAPRPILAFQIIVGHDAYGMHL